MRLTCTHAPFIPVTGLSSYNIKHSGRDIARHNRSITTSGSGFYEHCSDHHQLVHPVLTVPSVQPRLHKASYCTPSASVMPHTMWRSVACLAQIAKNPMMPTKDHGDRPAEKISCKKQHQPATRHTPVLFHGQFHLPETAPALVSLGIMYESDTIAAHTATSSLLHAAQCHTR